jgi:hypothetical protein
MAASGEPKAPLRRQNAPKAFRRALETTGHAPRPESSEWIIRSDVGEAGESAYPRSEMLLEVGIVVLSVICFVLLDLYVLGCEKV